jgi:SAM-dependent methyltransferase
MPLPPGFDREAFRQFERSGYSGLASAYDSGTARVTAQVNDPMLDAVGAGRGTRLLDVACGPGRLSAAASQRGCRVTGIDFAEPMVALARRCCPSGEFLVADAESLPFESDRFDAVVCNLGLLHFPDPEHAICEAKRVLRPGGRYAFTCWLPPDRNALFGLIFGAVQKFGLMDMPLPPAPPQFRFGERAECERTLQACGLEVLSAQEVMLRWDFDSPEQIVPGVIASTARLGSMLSLQSGERRRNIEQAIADGARAYFDGRRVSIPAPVMLAVARRHAG